MTTYLWLVEVALSLIFLFAGGLKLVKSRSSLRLLMPWVEDFGQGAIRLIGLVEVLAAVGIVLPAIAGILPEVILASAASLALIMGGAAVTHMRRREYFNVAVNLVLFALALFVAVYTYPQGVGLP